MLLYQQSIFTTYQYVIFNQFCMNFLIMLIMMGPFTWWLAKHTYLIRGQDVGGHLKKSTPSMSYNVLLWRGWDPWRSVYVEQMTLEPLTDIIKTYCDILQDQNLHIALKFDRHHGISAAKMPIKCQSDGKILKQDIHDDGMMSLLAGPLWGESTSHQCICLTTGQ